MEEYGSTETGSLAGECPEGRLHLWADRALFEAYDPVRGTSAWEGSGQLVVTTLYHEAMPLVRYNLEDNVEISYTSCACGWELPQVRVLGRSAFGYPVVDASVNQHDLEEVVFELPDHYQVLFWRARAEPTVLRLEVEVADVHRDAVTAELTEAIRRQLGVPSEVSAVRPGTLVSQDVLTGVHDVVKPRSLFGPDEDWSKAVLYY